MEFLDHTYVWDWCRTNGYCLDEGADHVAPWLADDLALAHRERTVHEAAGNAEAALKVSVGVLELLGNWDTCLAWVTDSDIWANKEDWPAYYRWRGDRGERRSLGAVPGHLFRRSDGQDFQFLLSHAIRFGWDVTLLPLEANAPSGMRVTCSHDGWIEVRSDKPVKFGGHAE